MRNYHTFDQEKVNHTDVKLVNLKTRNNDYSYNKNIVFCNDIFIEYTLNIYM